MINTAAKPLTSPVALKWPKLSAATPGNTKTAPTVPATAADGAKLGEQCRKQHAADLDLSSADESVNGDGEEAKKSQQPVTVHRTAETTLQQIEAEVLARLRLILLIC